MERRGFLKFLGALAPAAAVAAKETLPPEQPAYSVMCGWCRKNFAATFNGKPPEVLPVMYCADCTKNAVVLDAHELEKELPFSDEYVKTIATDNRRDISIHLAPSPCPEAKGWKFVDKGPIEGDPDGRRSGHWERV